MQQAKWLNLGFVVNIMAAIFVVLDDDDDDGDNDVDGN